MCEILLRSGPMPRPTLRIAAFFTALLVAPQVGSAIAMIVSPFGVIFHPDAPVFAIIAFFAPMAGYDTYLIYGAPIFAVLVLFCHGGAVMGALAGALALFIAAQVEDPGLTSSVAMIFAPLWGATFSVIYRQLALS